DYAIKWYNKRDIDRDAVEREYDTLRLLGGAGGHAPKAYALGRTWHDGARRWAIVMELMGGSTLKEAYDSLCEDGEVTLDARRALAALGQVARACEACREACEDRGVNRDLQPRNVMVEVDPERREVTHAAIVDWGQAPESPTKDTFAKAATLPFAAPEMFGGKYRRAPWRNAATVDVWSLGALGFWLRTKEVPLKDELEGVDGFKDGANEGRAEIKRGGIDLGPWLEEHGIPASPLDERLSDLIAECTRFDPDERPRTPGEVADRVDGILVEPIEEPGSPSKKSQASCVPWETPSNKPVRSKLGSVVLDDDLIISSEDERRSGTWDDARESTIGENAAVDKSALGAGLEPNRPTAYSESDTPDPYASVGRNDPCPCGSGKKYKFCHGRLRRGRASLHDLHESDTSESDTPLGISGDQQISALAPSNQDTPAPKKSERGQGRESRRRMHLGKGRRRLLFTGVGLGAGALVALLLLFVVIPSLPVTVRFVGNGAQGSMGDQTVNPNTHVFRFSPGGFRRDCYRFVGWSLSPSGSVIESSQSVGEYANLMPRSTTLYATWEFDPDAAARKLTITHSDTWQSSSGKQYVGLTIKNNSSLTLSYAVEYTDSNNTMWTESAVGPGEERFVWGFSSTYKITSVKALSRESLGGALSWREQSYEGGKLTISVTNNSKSYELSVNIFYIIYRK
ncbi:MAG: SEC-C metal-binding domain-containing protein, partial [Olsenella sp.]